VFQLTYISTATANLPSREIERILERSRVNNQRCDVTGLLLFDGKRFLQTLEGEQGVIEAVYAKIRADARHRAPVQLTAGIIERRLFGDWAMAFHAVDRTRQGELASRVDALVAQVADANLRALFTSFARLKRAA
jgi:hypothetical protein